MCCALLIDVANQVLVAVDDAGDVLTQIPPPPYILCYPKAWYTSLAGDGEDVDMDNDDASSAVSPAVKSRLSAEAIERLLALKDDNAMIVRAYKAEPKGPYAAARTERTASVPFTPTQGMYTGCERLTFLRFTQSRRLFPPARLV